ncbi:MAG: four helix bundle protein [Candidatus Marinimicrobia bacterium]|nr:four helix bundle protein [Candidatus Neomarinimicrobiota bacterium]
MNKKKNELLDLSYDYASLIVKLYTKLIKTKKEYIMSKQLLRCGTSVGANVREAQNAESRADFIHKLAIAQKECDENIFWLELMYENKYLTKKEFDYMIPKVTSILKMLKSSILTTKQNS